MNAHSWTPPVSGVPAEDLPLWNAAMSHMGAALPLGPTGAILRLSPIGAPDLQGACAAVGLASGGTAYVHVDAFPFNALLGVAFDIEALRRLEGPLQNAVHEGAVQALLDIAPDEITKMSFVGFEHKAECEARDLVWFAARLDGLCAEPTFFSVGLPATDLCAFLKSLVISPRIAVPGLKSQVKKPLLRFVGQAGLRMADVQGLEAGDLIILDELEPAELTLQDGDALYMFETAETGWTCTDTRTLCLPDGSLMMDENFDPNADASVEEAPRVEMTEIAQALLTFDLGEVSLSLAELEQFQIGGIVALPEDVQKAPAVEVNLRISGTKIATGDLIQIDDRIAVRLNTICVSA